MEYYQKVPQIVGANLKRLLKEKQITQLAFSRKANVSTKTVSRWISNGINSLETVYRIACVLNVDVFTILPR